VERERLDAEPLDERHLVQSGEIAECADAPFAEDFEQYGRRIEMCDRQIGEFARVADFTEILRALRREQCEIGGRCAADARVEIQGREPRVQHGEKRVHVRQAIAFQFDRTDAGRGVFDKR
jgi:hypothetical protein